MDVIRLEKSGLPLYLDEKTGEMALGGRLALGGMGHKCVGDMLDLLADGQGANEREAIYDTYRSICFPADKAAFEARGMCYDVTVIAPGCVNGEYKKTSGHYHGWNASHTHTFGEVYEVISGTAMYVLQKSPDFDKHPESPEITDIIFVTVHEGETLLVPPDYGHCSVNIGTTPLVFSNVAYTPAPVIYDSVRAHRGMAYYVMEDRGGVSTVQNPRYDLVSLPRPKYATVHEDPSLGSDFSVPAYLNFMERPESYGHLPNPDPYIDRIMDLLDFE